jgi:hypothetical protein
MTPREGFRFGFLYRCAEEGLTAAEALDRARSGLEKRAGLAAGLGTAWEGLRSLGGVGKTLGGLGVLGLVGAPALAGAGIGLGLAKTQEHDVDPDEVRNQELISAYRFHAEQARRRALLKHYRAGGPAP